jgi:DNA mismatch repair protein MutL
MGIIRLLPEDLINKIAAGEVVERPASVIKELIENSIDAKATHIQIILRDAGIESMRIIDDGIGMDPEDARLCMTRHATSKLKGLTDLFAIRTLGFRGEALSSIAAVSNFKLKTKTPDALTGTCVSNNLTEECTCARGTDITVEGLFENMPARKKHLRAPPSELKSIVDVVTAHAIANPGIHFVLSNNGENVLNLPAAVNLRERALAIYGKQVSQLIDVVVDHESLALEGLISPPESLRKDRRLQTLIMNNRPVRSEQIIDAIYEGYKSWIGAGQHPCILLRITVKPDAIDVNVHPSKMEIRLMNQSVICHLIGEMVSNALSSRKVIRSAPVANERPLALSDFCFKAERHQPIAETKAVEEYRIIGQVKKTYLLVENKAGFLIIDQHAAQERVLFERFKSEIETRIRQQELVEPIVAELSPKDSVMLLAHMDNVRRWGFEVETFGRNSFLIRKIPASFPRLAASTVFSQIIDSFSAKQNDDDIIRKACKAAIKANHHLEIAEIRQLLTELFACKQPMTCPHGRPTILSYTVSDLERMFKRSGF